MSWIEDLDASLVDMRREAEAQAAREELSSRITGEALAEWNKIADRAARILEADKISNLAVRYSRLALIGLGFQSTLDVLQAADSGLVSKILDTYANNFDYGRVMPIEADRRRLLEASLGLASYLGTNDHLSIRVAAPSKSENSVHGILGKNITYFEANKAGTLALVERVAYACGFIDPSKGITGIWRNLDQTLRVPHPNARLDFIAIPKNPNTPKSPAEWATHIIIRNQRTLPTQG